VLHRDGWGFGRLIDNKTAGYAGGYIQGGGHSVLSSMYGMAADQALEFEVITTSGKFVRASPRENPDLFWALSGGVRW